MSATQLIALAEYSPAAVFTAEFDAAALVSEVREKATSEVFDLSTAKGRKEIASMAAKVAKCKTALDGMGKDYVSGLKAQAKEVDNVRSFFRKKLDDIRDEVRAPLNEWEAAQKAREAAYSDFASTVNDLATPEYGASVEDLRSRMNELNEKDTSVLAQEFRAPASDALEAAKAKLAPMMSQAEAQAKAALEDAERKRQAEETQARFEAEQAKAQRIENERLADENAKLKAERDAEQKRQAEAQKIRDEEAAEAKAKAEALDAERQEEIDAANARQAAAVAETASVAKEAADKAADRKNVEDMARVLSENSEHRKTVDQEAIQALFLKMNLDDSQATEVIRLISSGEIPAVSIKY